jgi:hypothetical protein
LFPVIEDVHPRPGKPPIALRTHLVDDVALVVDPWLFDEPALGADVPGRRVSAEPFESEGAFRTAWAAAPIESIHFQLRKP